VSLTAHSHPLRCSCSFVNSHLQSLMWLLPVALCMINAAVAKMEMSCVLYVAVRPLSLCLCSLIFCAVVFIAYLLHDFHGVDMNLHGCSTSTFDSTTQRNTKSQNKSEKYSPCTLYHFIWRMEWFGLVYLSLSHTMDSFLS